MCFPPTEQQSESCHGSQLPIADVVEKHCFVIRIVVTQHLGWTVISTDEKLVPNLSKSVRSKPLAIAELGPQRRHKVPCSGSLFCLLKADTHFKVGRKSSQRTELLLMNSIACDMKQVLVLKREKKAQL